MSLIDKIKETFKPVPLNDPEADQALMQTRRLKAGQQMGEQTTRKLLEEHASDAGVVDPETSLLIHHPENWVPSEPNASTEASTVPGQPLVPEQRSSTEDKELVSAK